MSLSRQEFESFVWSALDQVRDMVDARKALSLLTGLLFLRFSAFVKNNRTITGSGALNPLDELLNSVPSKIDWDHIKGSSQPEHYFAEVMHSVQASGYPWVNGLMAAL